MTSTIDSFQDWIKRRQMVLGTGMWPYINMNIILVRKKHLSPCKSLYTNQMNLKFIYRIYMYKNLCQEGLKFDQMKTNIIWVLLNTNVSAHLWWLILFPLDCKARILNLICLHGTSTFSSTDPLWSTGFSFLDVSHF